MYVFTFVCLWFCLSSKNATFYAAFYIEMSYRKITYKTLFPDPTETLDLKALQKTVIKLKIPKALEKIELGSWPMRLGLVCEFVMFWTRAERRGGRSRGYLGETDIWWKCSHCCLHHQSCLKDRFSLWRFRDGLFTTQHLMWKLWKESLLLMELELSQCLGLLTSGEALRVYFNE